MRHHERTKSPREARNESGGCHDTRARDDKGAGTAATRPAKPAEKPKGGSCCGNS